MKENNAVKAGAGWASPPAPGFPELLGCPPGSAAGGKQLLQPPGPICPALLSCAGPGRSAAGDAAAACERRSPAAARADAAGEQPGASDP